MTQWYVALMFGVVAAFVVAIFAVLANIGDFGWLFSSESGARDFVLRLTLTGIISVAVALYLGLSSLSASKSLKSSLIFTAASLCILNWNLLSLVPLLFALGASIWWRLRPAA